MFHIMEILRVLVDACFKSFTGEWPIEKLKTKESASDMTCKNKLQSPKERRKYGEPLEREPRRDGALRRNKRATSRNMPQTKRGAAKINYEFPGKIRSTLQLPEKDESFLLGEQNSAEEVGLHQGYRTSLKIILIEIYSLGIQPKDETYR